MRPANETDDVHMDTTPPGHEGKTEKRRNVVAPWKNIAEFERVYDALYAHTANDDTRRAAMSDIRVWKLRRSVLCPAAVLATGVIVDVQLKDDGSARFTPDELRTLYASAFTRFYNFMSSILQTHSMRTMYDTAHELGLQSFVVDLRHLCAHGQVLPPLELLRHTADYCLDWLHTYYWRGQLASMREVVDAVGLRRRGTTQLEASIGQLFGLYDTTLECLMRGATDLKTAKRYAHGSHAALKKYCVDHELNELDDVMAALLKDLAAFMRCEANTKDLQEVYVESLLKMKYFLLTGASPLTNDAHERLVATTQGLFRLLAVIGCIEPLFHALLSLAEDTATADSAQELVRRIGAAFWAHKIAEGFVTFRRCKQLYKKKLEEQPKFKEWNLTALNVDSGLPKQVRGLLISARVDMQRTLFFGDSRQRPWVWLFGRDWLGQRLSALNTQTLPVLKCLLPLVEPPLAMHELATLNGLIDALFDADGPDAAAGGMVTAANKNNSNNKNNSSNNNNNNSNTAAASPVYTAADLLARLGDTTGPDTVATADDVRMADDCVVHEGTAEKSFGEWTLVPDDVTHNWGRCPLGRLPWD